MGTPLFWAVVTVVGAAVVAAVVAGAIVEGEKPRSPALPHEPGDQKPAADMVLARVVGYWPRPRDTMECILSLRRNDFVRWQATPPFFDARLTTFGVFALRGSLDSVLAARLMYRHTLFDEEPGGRTKVYPLSWAAQNHLCWPALDGVIMDSSSGFTMLLVALDDVDFVLCPRWTRVPPEPAARRETPVPGERAAQPETPDPDERAMPLETPARTERAGGPGR